MNEYHKIVTVFKRNPENMRYLLEGEWALPEFEYLKDNEWFTVDEWKLAERTTAEIIQVIQNKVNEHKIRQVYPDPAEPDRIEEMKREGLSVGLVKKNVPLGLSYAQLLFFLL